MRNLNHRPVKVSKTILTLCILQGHFACKRIQENDLLENLCEIIFYAFLSFK